jgi:hypothetical protein
MSFIIPQWIELTDEEDAALTQAALEWGRKRERRNARRRARYAEKKAGTKAHATRDKTLEILHEPTNRP